MATTSGRPKYNDTYIDMSTAHIFKAPYQSVMAPRAEKVIPADVINELNQDTEYTSEHFNVIPWGTNIASNMNYGHGTNANRSVKTSKNGTKGYMGQEPFFHPEGGWQFTWDAKLPEEYYADNRRGVRYVELPENIEHWEDPIIAFPNTNAHNYRYRTSNIVPVAPTAVFEIDIPTTVLSARQTVYKGRVSLSGIDAPNEQIELPNPTRIVKYIQNKNIKHVLPQVYETYIKIAERKIPIKFKNPNYVVMQASDSQAIDIPLPNGSSFKMRDYQWTVVQNVDAETELVFEVPVNLKDRPDLSYNLSQITANYEKTVEKQHGKTGESHLNLTYSAPVHPVDQSQYIEQNVPELFPSKTYYTVDNALEVFPSSLEPTQAVLRKNPRVVFQPEPIGTFPWMH